MRTDLDSFSDTEAFALMTSGYQMAEQTITPEALGFEFDRSRPGVWEFFLVEPAMKDGNPDSSLMRRLKVAEKIALKVWRLSRLLQIGASVAAVVIIAVLMLKMGWRELLAVELGVLTVGGLGIGLLVIIAGLLSTPILRLVRFPKTPEQLLIGVGMATFGFVVARLHLHLFDKLFLWDGRLRRRL
jgi:hypothetical protein